MSDIKKPSGQEGIKERSQHLRGNISAELADTSTTTVSDETYELLKFHGSYFGYDRDTATALKQQGKDKHYEFMVRVKIPGGRITADQYLALDEIADTYANGTLRVTTRETIQFHCIVKQGLKPAIAAINQALLTTFGGCGDVVRNVITCPAPVKDAMRLTLERDAVRISEHTLPKTGAYHEIWMDGEKLSSSEEVDPLYKDLYLPRKFKIALADPLDNCMDALTNDLAIFYFLNEDGSVKGYNFALGGGLGMTHNKPNTYPRLASQIAFVEPEDLIRVTDAVIGLQRDHGDRSDRKHARLKYVMDEKGLAWTRNTLEQYAGKKLSDPVFIPKFAIENHLGWHEQGDGKWFLGIPVSSGRIIDREEEAIRTGLKEVVRTYKMPVTLTADQNVILCDIEPGEKGAIEALLRKYHIKLKEEITPVFENFIACVALPTCGKALAEAERVKLPMVSDIEKLMAKHGVLGERITIRLSGCPNGCSRPYVGDIGIVGRTPDTYALFIGGDFEGTRLNTKIFDKVPMKDLPETLDVFFEIYGKEHLPQEGFGDFCHRVGIDPLLTRAKAVLSPKFKWAA